VAIVDGLTTDFASYGGISGIMTFNHIVLIKLHSSDAAQILREAMGYGYRATVLAYAFVD
jgi:hypothetical protein